MTDLTPKQIEDALTDEELRWEQLFTFNDPTTQFVRGVIVSLAECRIENKRLKKVQPAVVALCKAVVDDQISETGNCQACSGETWSHYNDCYVSQAETLLREIGGK